MLKLTKKADYALMAMKHLAEHASEGSRSAKDVADAYGIPPEALAKILQRLAKAGLLQSQHGTNGGYTLARPPEKISVAEIIDALEGPIGFTECNSAPGCCELEPSCTVRSNSLVISRALRRTLAEIRLTDLIRPLHFSHVAGDHHRNVVSITLSSGRTQ